MKKITQRLAINLFAFLVLMCFMSFGQSTATYTITFTGTWNNTDHSDNGNTPLPPDDHWSDLIGTTHNANITFWELGQLATSGIEDVAEAGNEVDFKQEINNAITANNAYELYDVDFSPNNALGMASIMSITVREEFPLLTLVSMIAPSPDWFIGINSFSLLDGSNNWKDTISIDMYTYDAGTEEGSTYSYDNAETNPQQNISSLTNVAPFNDQKVGTMTIALESVLSTGTTNFKSGIHLSPNPSKGIIYINNATSETIKNIQVFDVIGKLVTTINLNSEKTKTLLNLENLNAGIYMVKVNSDKGNASIKKLVIE